MPIYQAFNIFNFANTGVYFNQYILKQPLTINRSYYSYPWSSFLNPLNDLSDDLKNLYSQTNSFSILYNNYEDSFLLKQQHLGIRKYKSQLKHNVAYSKATLNRSLESYSQIAKLFNIPVIIIQADIFSLSIIQYIPIPYKLKVKWKINKVNINFKSISSFVKNVLANIGSFLSIENSSNDINNIFFNFLNFRTAKITDTNLIDILRAIFMELFIRAVSYIEIPNLNQGIVILTGEYPALIKQDAYVLLSVIDGLVLRGLWGIIIDNNFNLINTLLIQKQVEMQELQLFKLALPSLDLFYNPLESEELPILNLSGIKSQKYFGATSNVVRFSVNRQYNRIFASNTSMAYEISFPTAMPVRSVIIDTRERPIEYGPDAINNKQNVGLSVYKLSNMLQ